MKFRDMNACAFNFEIHPEVYELSCRISEKIGWERALQQLAEECSELAQASLKLVRSIDGKNPTNKTGMQCVTEWHEEISDVLVSLVVTASNLNADDIESVFKNKLRRWEERLNENS